MHFLTAIHFAKVGSFKNFAGNSISKTRTRLQLFLLAKAAKKIKM